MRSFALLALVLVGCGSDPTSIAWNGSIHGTGDAAPTRTIDGMALDASARACAPSFVGVARDFRDTHPDFEKFIGDDRGIVLAKLGMDDKPVYASATTTPTTTGKATFDQWYRDVPGTNTSKLFTLPLQQQADGTYVFDSSTFFPLDGEGFGNQGRVHNFHFTYELHTRFVYRGGEKLTFNGDDDLWVFVHRTLAIDLGGTHPAESATIDLDALQSSLGLVRGETYELSIFQAERHTDQSSFRMQTTIGFVNCDPILP